MSAAERAAAAPSLCILGVPDAGAQTPSCQAVLSRLALRAGWQVRQVAEASEEEVDGTAAVVLLLGSDGPIPRRQYPQALFVAESAVGGVDLALSGSIAESALDQLLRHGELHWRRNLKIMELYREVAARRQRMGQLSDIALSLSTRMEFNELLETILLEARRLAECDAGSLYLIEEHDGGSSLVFKLAQNDSVDVPFVEQRLPVSAESLAGYVAVSGEALDIPDAYQIPDDAPYRFNRSFDEEMNYRTRSMLVLPMRDHRHRIVGVLQFINRMDPTGDEPIPFGDEIVELLRAIASQAAVSIQKNLLIRDVERLFESFVQASVKAIEQRDPSTSGHSFRVAESTLSLLKHLPCSGLARFRDLTFSDDHLREVRYAALLHDFGKVGVRENILLKANKLSGDRLEVIRCRLEIHKERLRRRAVERELELLHDKAVDLEVARRRVHRELQSGIQALDDFYACIERVNSPKVHDDGDYSDLRRLRAYALDQMHVGADALLTDEEMLALSVPKGSLTPEERLEIESHVRHTRDFLAVLPWPPELAQVPAIAGAHHEKLDGSGYPMGLSGDEIPLASRVMTVCDIYDALTAMDRPYKNAVSAQAALNILEEEAGLGLLDADMVRVFIESGIYLDSWAGHRSSRKAV